MSAFRYGRFRLAGRDFAGVGDVVKACEEYAAKARRPWSAGLVGIVADDQVGAGASVVLARATGAADGSVTFEDLEPAEGEELPNDVHH
ncbi:hypothetical protein [Paludisphaera rhizosphaerae]|uniref:hypothetical protein n=1 Tax=Paludisphaera rhizosphaerae TaxID=2711216 RepID=UPI0013EA8A28|nr:hypothetical protein [Paludisphaera rhizosphaerae]